MLCSCGARADAADQLVCKKCLTPFSFGKAKTGAGKAREVKARFAPTEHVVVRRRSLTLEFADGTLSLAPGETRGLGRDPEFSADSRFFATFGTVSGRHAKLELRRDGSAWISDENSTNATYVNGRMLPPRQPHPLNDGDTVRFAQDLHAVVRLIAR
ncbi:FHA domain-containing protein [Actinocorallia herbida]|uniref:FHA domain-containing protein n=1 Tax=Actinocorallia herbida TaxID=58109 RepID=A0A3N1D6K5_9ACTN|nr:FHA domain-containing protein [Actinocorallia herbida]ROO89099.1 FHA domain-containing protein [Actinocorallia herbida]